MRSRSTAARVLGVVAFVVAVVGYTVFGWRFGDGASNPVAFGLAIVAAVVAVGLTLRDRL